MQSDGDAEEQLLKDLLCHSETPKTPKHDYPLQSRTTFQKPQCLAQHDTQGNNYHHVVK